MEADLGLDANTRSGQVAGAGLASSPLPAGNLTLREGGPSLGVRTSHP